MNPAECVRELPPGALLVLERTTEGLWRGELWVKDSREVAQCDFVQGLIQKLAVQWSKR